MFGHDATQPATANDNTATAPPVSTAPSNDVPSAPPTPAIDETAHDSDASPVDTGLGGARTDELLNIKQDALKQLSPLVSHLDQTPEEKFRTTMMMIQAADDQSLIKQAYDAAQNIPDEKARAQALLDIINEINYFTQHKDN